MMEYNEEEKEDEVDEKEKEEAGFINEEYIRNLMNYNVHNDVEDILNLNNKVSSGNDLDINNNKNNNNKIDNENEKEEEDDREIYKMFEDKLYKNEYINEKNQQMNKEKEKKEIPISSIKNQQSRLMNKYFSNALNNNNINNNNKKNTSKKSNQNQIFIIWVQEKCHLFII